MTLVGYLLRHYQIHQKWGLEVWGLEPEGLDLNPPFVIPHCWLCDGGPSRLICLSLRCLFFNLSNEYNEQVLPRGIVGRIKGIAACKEFRTVPGAPSGLHKY